MRRRRRRGDEARRRRGEETRRRGRVFPVPESILRRNRGVVRLQEEKAGPKSDRTGSMQCKQLGEVRRGVIDFERACRRVKDVVLVGTVQLQLQLSLQLSCAS